MLPGPAVPDCCLISFHFWWGKLSTRTVVADLTGNPVYSLVFGVCQSSKKFFEGLTEEAGKGGNVFLSTLATSCHHQRHLARP